MPANFVTTRLASRVPRPADTGPCRALSVCLPLPAQPKKPSKFVLPRSLHEGCGAHRFVAQALDPLAVAGRQQLPNAQAVGGRERLPPGREGLEGGTVIARRRDRLAEVLVPTSSRQAKCFARRGGRGKRTGLIQTVQPARCRRSLSGGKR